MTARGPAAIVVPRSRRVGIWALAAWAGLLFSAQAADPKEIYSIGPEPSWVEPVPLPAHDNLPEDKASDGIYFLLSDGQTRAEPREIYSQYARKVLNESGVQNGSEILISVDPAYEHLTLHRVEVQRNGEWKNRLNPDGIQVLRREADMERFLLDGRYSVVMRLSDIRPGDVIRYSFTHAGANPVMAGHFFHSFATGWSQPCAHFRERIWMPAGRKLFLKNHDTDLAPVIRPESGLTLYEWEARDIPAVVSEPGVPYWVNVFPWIETGDMGTWQDVNDWARPLYDFGQPLPADLEQQIVEFAALPTNEAKIQSALKMVQDSVRYFGTETGEYSHKPRPPAEVYDQRFGDCKEKVLLLGTVLRRLGLEADPVLVSSSTGKFVKNRLPSPGAFDHVILRVRNDGETFYVDPTRNYQRGPLGQLGLSHFGWGLVVGLGEADLHEVGPRPEALARDEIFETLVLPDLTNEKPARLTVKTVLRGASAEASRERFATTPREQLLREYMRYYTPTFPGIEPGGALRGDDYPGENAFVIQEEYQISGIWKPQQDKKDVVAFSLFPHALTAYLEKPGTAGRKFPFALAYPVEVSLSTTVQFPETWNVAAIQADESNPFFDFRYRMEGSGPTARITASYRSLADHVPPGDLPVYRAAVEKVMETAGCEFSYNHGLEKGAASGGFVWSIPVAMVLSAIPALTAALIIGLTGRNQPRRRCPPEDKALDGLGGWLILMGIGIVINPIRSGFGLASSLAPFLENPDVWFQFTSPAGQFYSPFWAPLFLFECIGNTILLVFQILLIFLFFQKRRIFPRVMIGVMGTSLFFVVVAALAFASVPPESMPPEMKHTSLVGDVTRAIYGAAIWIPYLLISRRVKATFRR